MKQCYTLAILLSLFSVYNVKAQMSPPRRVPSKNQTESKAFPQFRKPDYKASRDVNATRQMVDFSKWVEETTADIMRVRPGAFTPNPSADTDVIRFVFDGLKKSRAKAALNDERILENVFTAWMNLAIEGYDKTGKEADYTQEDLLNKAMNLSELYIQTKPTGAKIIADGYDRGSSDKSFWIEEGKRSLLLKKEGYIPLQETIIIKEDSEPMSLLKILKPVK